LSETNIVLLAAVVDQHTRPLTFSENGERLYVFGSVSGRLSASVFDVTQKPPANVFNVGNLGNERFSPVIAAGGRLYSGVGRVYLPPNLDIEHTFFVEGVWASVAPEPELNRVFYLHGSLPPRLTVFDLATRQTVDSALVGGFVGLTGYDSFWRWGADGLAFRTPTDVYLLRRNTVPILPGRDSDADGMTDEWEVAHDFNPNWPTDADLDADNDGGSNLAEFRAGTDPGTRDVFLGFARSTTQTTNFGLRWMTTTGLRYQVEMGDHLIPSQWTPASDVVLGTGQQIEIPLPILTNSHQFFRVRVLP
jgi:hypothetical protein